MASIIEQHYQTQVSELSAAERMARSVAMLQWTRQLLARQVTAEMGDMPPERLKLEVALRQYGSEPAVRAMIEERLQHVPH